MAKTLSFLLLLVLLGVAAPAQAQLRQNVPAEQSAARLYDAGTPGLTLNKLFSPQHFRMGHSYEMSMSSFGGQTSSMGMYTNTLQWQFNQRLAARVDVGVAHNLFGDMPGAAFGLQQQGPQVFLRNAEVVYRPTETMRLHFQVRQSPYGGYAGPYGYSPYYGQAYHMGVGSRDADLFWNDSLR